MFFQSASWKKHCVTHWREQRGKWGVFHSPKNSGNSVWVVNGTWFFGSFHWKISRKKKGIPEKVVPFSRWNFPMEICVPFTDFLVFITSSMPFAVFQAARRLSCFNKNGGWSGSVFWNSKLFANKLLGLLLVLCLPRYSARSGNLLQHECAVCKSSR